MLDALRIPASASSVVTHLATSLFCGEKKLQKQIGITPGELAETLAEEVGHLDKEGAAVSPETWLQLTSERIKAVAIEVVVVSEVKSRPGTRCPAKQKLRFEIGRDRIKIDSTARKNESCELIGAFERNDVLVKC